MSTSNTSAMRVKVSTDGCVWLLHHLEIVAGSFTNCLPSHFPLLFFSTRSIFSLFICFISVFCYDLKHKHIDLIANATYSQLRIKPLLLFFDTTVHHQSSSGVFNQQFHHCCFINDPMVVALRYLQRYGKTTIDISETYI